MTAAVPGAADPAGASPVAAAHTAGGARRTRIAVLALLALVGLLYIEPLWLLKDRLGADDSSYFAHAATLALDADLDYGNERVVQWNADRTIASHPVGSGVLAAPFVAAFSIIDRVRGHAVIDDRSAARYSWSLFGFWVAAVVYFLVGVGLFARGLGVLGLGIDPRLNLLLAFSTGVPFYVLRRFTMAHAFEFAGLAFAFWAAARLYDALARDGDARRWILLSALAAALNLTLRIGNLNTLFLAHALVLATWGLGISALPRPSWSRVRRALLSVAGWTVVALLPLAAFNTYFFGMPYPTPTAMYGLPVTGTESRTPLELIAHGIGLVPNLLPLILGSEFGVLYTNPVVVLGGGLVLLAVGRAWWRGRDRARLLALVAVAAYLGFSTALVLWWQTTATSYGYRYLFPLYPLALLGLVAAWRAAAAYGVRARRAARGVVLGLCVVSIASQTFFLATPALSLSEGTNIYGVHHGATANGYMRRLPIEMLRPVTWASLAARRYAGYLAGPVVVRTPVAERLPEDWLRGYDRVYSPAPVDADLQLLLLFMIWVGGAAIVAGRSTPGRRAPVKRAPNERRARTADTVRSRARTHS